MPSMMKNPSQVVFNGRAFQYKDSPLKVSVGDQVAIAGLKRCGQCYSCRSGIDNLCDNARSKRVPDVPWGPGGFGDYMLAEGYQVFRVGPVATPLEAALTEPTACVLHDMKRHRVHNGDVVVIVGAGIMGLLHLVIARQTPSFIIVSEPEAPRREKARELGADAVIDPTTEDGALTLQSFVWPEQLERLGLLRGAIEAAPPGPLRARLEEAAWLQEAGDIQGSTDYRLHEAQVLRAEGKPRAALEALEPVLATLGQRGPPAA